MAIYWVVSVGNYCLKFKGNHDCLMGRRQDNKNIACGRELFKMYLIYAVKSKRYNETMSELLKNISNRAEEYKGRRLVKLLAIIFVVFLVLGLSAGFVVDMLSPDEVPLEVTDDADKNQGVYEGTITFIEPMLHVEDGISFILTDKADNDIILLKAKDQKLEVSEGHFATVYGEMRKTVTLEDYLLVEKIVIRNVPD